MQYQFHYDQQQLRELCADRPLETTEVHPPNDYYGQASVIKRYVRLPERYSLKGVVEHGVILADEVWDVDRRALLPVNLGCSTARADTLRRETGKLSIPIGFGFLYAMALVDRQHGPARPADDRRGTIAFPIHSTHTTINEFDYEDFADQLEALPECMQPVYVSIYWKDYLRGAHTAYQKRGIPVITAGHMYDQDFFLRLYDACRQFRYAVANDVATCLFLSVASQCRFSLLATPEVTTDEPDFIRDFRARVIAGKVETVQRARQLFGRVSEMITQEQLQFVDDLLGMSHVKTPEELRRVLRGAEIRDKLVVRPTWGEPLPPFLRRGLRSAERSVKRCLPQSLRKKKAA